MFVFLIPGKSKKKKPVKQSPTLENGTAEDTLAGQLAVMSLVTRPAGHGEATKSNGKSAVEKPCDEQYTSRARSTIPEAEPDRNQNRTGSIEAELGQSRTRYEVTEGGSLLEEKRVVTQRYGHPRPKVKQCEETQEQMRSMKRAPPEESAKKQVSPDTYPDVPSRETSPLPRSGLYPEVFEESDSEVSGDVKERESDFFSLPLFQRLSMRGRGPQSESFLPSAVLFRERKSVEDWHEGGGLGRDSREPGREETSSSDGGERALQGLDSVTDHGDGAKWQATSKVLGGAERRSEIPSINPTEQAGKGGKDCRRIQVDSRSKSKSRTCSDPLRLKSQASSSSTTTSREGRTVLWLKEKTRCGTTSEDLDPPDNDSQHELKTERNDTSNRDCLKRRGREKPAKIFFKVEFSESSSSDEDFDSTGSVVRQNTKPGIEECTSEPSGVSRKAALKSKLVAGGKQRGNVDEVFDSDASVFRRKNTPVIEELTLEVSRISKKAAPKTKQVAGKKQRDNVHDSEVFPEKVTSLSGVKTRENECPTSQEFPSFDRKRFEGEARESDEIPGNSTSKENFTEVADSSQSPCDIQLPAPLSERLRERLASRAVLRTISTSGACHQSGKDLDWKDCEGESAFPHMKFVREEASEKDKEEGSVDGRKEA